ncbi:oxidation resistance protein 1a isoform X4 [Pelmatolapia mariae]|uniref:oxidation resistance protein 1a isoform X4 n=1 Tax=Pelmatolapia mariae TaxID=158779 RepID=UPI002FE60C49
MEPIVERAGLKKKSQSVDIASQGFSPTLVPASPLNKAAPSVAKTTTVLAVQENNTTNSQRRSPRCGELKRGYTIDTGQKKTPEKKDGRRMSFQRPKGTIEYSDSDGPPKPEAIHPPVFSALRQSRVVSSTSEEEEALTEKFLKINCKYITDGKGAVSGVLLVTPNNIMFDPHRMDPLVQAHGCEEYGIMCPLEEVQSAAICKEITDPKIRETVPDDLEPLPAERHPSQQKEPDQRLKEPGTNDSGSTAPRSTEGSFSEDVFTETELSPIREEEQASSEDLRLDKSSGASTESVQTITQVEAASSQTAGSARGSASQPEEPTVAKAEDNPPETATENDNQSPMGSKQHSVEKPPSTPTTTNNTTTSSTTSQAQGPSSSNSCPGSQSSATTGATETTSVSASPQVDANQGADASQTDTMQQGKEKEDAEQTQKDGVQNSAEGTGSTERRKHRSHKFLCLRVGKPMKKTFVSNASASMQQYAQLGKKHEYWFAVPQERSDHLYVFFMQWSPDMYGEGVGGMGQEPGFRVVKKNEVKETNEHEPITDLNVKEWEVVSLTEYHRRIDALNSEDLRSLCKRLQITTKEEVNSKHGTVKTELEPDTFKPNLREPSELLEADQIEKLARNLPPRTIGYPWTLVFGTAKHGMSIKTLYRSMQAQDTPVLLVIKDSDGQVFGALASEPFKVSDGFYGTGETFLFTFNPEFEVYKWTGDNMFFIKGDMDSLAFGGGSGEFGLWLDGDLYHGRSHSCKTFGNPMLSKKEDFYVQDIEIWAFE